MLCLLKVDMTEKKESLREWAKRKEREAEGEEGNSPWMMLAGSAAVLTLMAGGWYMYGPSNKTTSAGPTSFSNSQRAITNNAYELVEEYIPVEDDDIF